MMILQLRSLLGSGAEEVGTLQVAASLEQRHSSDHRQRQHHDPVYHAEPGVGKSQNSLLVLGKGPTDSLCQLRLSEGTYMAISMPTAHAAVELTAVAEMPSAAAILLHPTTAKSNKPPDGFSKGCSSAMVAWFVAAQGRLAGLATQAWVAWLTQEPSVSLQPLAETYRYLMLG